MLTGLFKNEFDHLRRSFGSRRRKRISIAMGKKIFLKLVITLILARTSGGM